ncbi:MAG TPA: P-loop NTPase [Polyangia bacterium]|jgi:MinD-like ATPase involved in chromosome partitioning or flagellar assembly|nr:P-loop NTPase [Polyangia bacterium]
MSFRDPVPKRPARPIAEAGRASAANRLHRVEVMNASRWRRPAVDKRPRIVAVGGGTMGVGKSSVASNLAVAIAGLGHQVVLVDLDLEAPQLHRLFGIDRPVPGLQALLHHEIENFDVSLTSTGIKNLHLIAGGDGADGHLYLDRGQKHHLARQINELESEVIVVDIGASNRGDLLDFFAIGAVRLAVSTSTTPALERAYAFLKGATRRAIDQYGGASEQALASFGGALIGNMSTSADDTERFHAFARLVEEHLGIQLPVLGCLRTDERVAESARQRRPLLALPGVDQNVHTFHRMAEHLMSDEVFVSPACDLVPATSSTFADQPLPSPLEAYMRRHPRHAVNWMATLIVGDRSLPVRMIDVSVSGAALEAMPGLTVGDQAVLRLDQLPGPPSVEVLIQNIKPTLSRIGVAFLGDTGVPAQLIDAAVNPRS